ncbi:hypothetical protein MNBD_GAMMA22-1602 [hydrothermal vent metagenome]|uniref:AB hydrolase-1 domain-containing protein n=1 Tax=hydrothermal vent metagenome TaxID=652676 RepID=A0A3B1AXD7_9ZZZZ
MKHHKQPQSASELVAANYQERLYKKNPRLVFMMKIIRLCFLILEYISPKLAGWWALRLWLATRRYPLPAREKIWLATATESSLLHQNGSIKLYRWQTTQTTAPIVLLIHGWNGRGLQLGAFVKPLLEQGFQVISFDAPGHGSSPGNESNLFIIADVVQAISKSVGSIHSIIAHSFGAMVMARAVNDGLNIHNAVVISAPKNVEFLTNLFCAMFKIKPNSKKNLLERIKRRFGDTMFDKASTINNLKKIAIPGLIVHDSHDEDIPVQHAQELNAAWVNSELLITENLGHLRILRDKNIITSIVKFIANN